ncbi:MAG: type II toxin-antitoxin system RelE/ParE family toxin [Galactobacter sp.]
MTYRLVLSPLARVDVVELLEWSLDCFGDAVRDGYEELINACWHDIQTDPRRAGSHDRPEVGREVRGIHLRSSRDRVPADVRRIITPRHIVFYRVTDDVVHISRVLHESREVGHHQFP